MTALRPIRSDSLAAGQAVTTIETATRMAEIVTQDPLSEPMRPIARSRYKRLKAVIIETAVRKNRRDATSQT